MSSPKTNTLVFLATFFIWFVGVLLFFIISMIAPYVFILFAHYCRKLHKNILRSIHIIMPGRYNITFPMTLRLKLHIYYLLYLLSTINTRHLPLTVIYASCRHRRIFSALGSQPTIFACYDVSRCFSIPRHPDALFGGPESRY